MAWPRCSSWSASAGRRASPSLPLDPGGSADADAGVPDPVPGARLCAAGLLKGWIHAVASVNPATAFLGAGRGLISGAQEHTALGFRCALALVVVFAVWTLVGLRAADARPRPAEYGCSELDDHLAGVAAGEQQVQRVGAFSRPSTMCSGDLIWPSSSHPATSAWASGKRSK